MWELFTYTLEAGEALGVADELLSRVRAARDKLYPPKIGRWGQLQEWIDDRDDPAVRHRHTSHLIGVYPGRHISVTEAPEWAKAAEVSLRARGETGAIRRRRSSARRVSMKRPAGFAAPAASARG